jgi:hypothetical protein
MFKRLTDWLAERDMMELGTTKGDEMFWQGCKIGFLVKDGVDESSSERSEVGDDDESQGEQSND